MLGHISTVNFYGDNAKFSKIYVVLVLVAATKLFIINFFNFNSINQSSHSDIT